MTIHTSASGAAPGAPRHNSAGDFEAARAQTLATMMAAANDIAVQLREGVRGGDAGEDRAALLARVKEELHRAGAELTAPEAAHALHSFTCDALRLHRACPRETCRKAQSCRGNPTACQRRADVPELVRDYVAWLMLAERLPWLTTANPQQRLAYECWIAGIEAGRA